MAFNEQAHVDLLWRAITKDGKSGGCFLSPGYASVPRAALCEWFRISQCTVCAHSSSATFLRLFLLMLCVGFARTPPHLPAVFALQCFLFSPGDVVGELVKVLTNKVRVYTMTLSPVVRDEQYKRALPKLTQFPRCVPRSLLPLVRDSACELIPVRVHGKVIVSVESLS